jgi:hypothetical protein
MPAMEGKADGRRTWPAPPHLTKVEAARLQAIFVSQKILGVAKQILH